MIQDAYLLLAMDEVNKLAQSRNESLVPGVFAEPSNVCNLIIDAWNHNKRSTLAAGYDYCVDRSDRTAKIYDNIVAQIELMGMPLSNGGKGEGVRLLLGSDITERSAVLVNDTSDPTKQVGGRAKGRDEKNYMHKHTHGILTVPPNTSPTRRPTTRRRTRQGMSRRGGCCPPASQPSTHAAPTSTTWPRPTRQAAPPWAPSAAARTAAICIRGGSANGPATSTCWATGAGTGPWRAARRGRSFEGC